MASLAEYIPLFTSAAALALLPTTLIPVNAIIKGVDSSTAAEVAYQLRTGGGGTVVPADYSAVSNNKSWFQV